MHTGRSLLYLCRTAFEIASQTHRYTPCMFSAALHTLNVPILLCSSKNPAKATCEPSSRSSLVLPRNWGQFNLSGQCFGCASGGVLSSSRLISCILL